MNWLDARDACASSSSTSKAQHAKPYRAEHQFLGPWKDEARWEVAATEGQRARIVQALRRGASVRAAVSRATLDLLVDMSGIQRWARASEAEMSVTLSAGERRSVLMAFSRALARETHNLSRWPDLLWQQLYNRLQGSIDPVPQVLARELTCRSKHPWLRLLSEAPWHIGRDAMATWSGNLPLVFSPDSRLAWAVDAEGTVYEFIVRTGERRHVWNNVCPHCRMSVYDVNSDILTVVGQHGELVRGRPGTGDLLQRWSLPNPTGEIAACRWSQSGILALVTYPDHGPAELLLIEPSTISADNRVVSYSVRLILRLDFGYVPQVPLTVLGGHPYAVCPRGDRGRDVVLVHITTGEVLQEYKGHASWISALATVERRDLLVSGAQDGTLRLWQLSTAELLYTVEGRFSQVHDLVWSESHDTLIAVATTGGDLGKGMAFLAWNLEIGGEPKITQCAHQYASRAVLSPDEKLLVTGVVADEWHGGGELLTWDVEPLLPTSEEAAEDSRETLTHHDSEVIALQTIRDGHQAVSVSRGGQCWVWDVEAARVAWRRAEEEGVIWACAVSPDGCYVVFTKMESEVTWRDGRPVFESWANSLVAYRFSRDVQDPFVPPVAWQSSMIPGRPDPCTWIPGSFRILFSRHGVSGVWDLDSGREVWSVEGDHPVLLGADAGVLVNQTKPSRKPAVLDLETGEAVRTLNIDPGDLVEWRAADGRPEQVIGVAESGALLVLDVESGELKEHSIGSDSPPVLCLAVSPCGSRAFLGLHHGLGCWDVDTGTILAWVPLSNRPSCVEAISRDRVIVGDMMGWVWQFEVGGVSPLG